MICNSYRIIWALTTMHLLKITKIMIISFLNEHTMQQIILVHQKLEKKLLQIILDIFKLHSTKIMVDNSGKDYVQTLE